MRSRALLFLAVLVPGAVRLAAAPLIFPVCEARFAASPGSEEAAECFYSAGRNQGLMSEAAHRLEELLASHPDHPWLLFYLGNLRWDEPARAEAPYRRAAAAFSRQDNAAGEIRAHTALHGVLAKLGRFDEAAAEVERVAAIALRENDPLLIARADILRAKDLRLRGGDLQRAYILLRAIRARVVPSGPHLLQRDALEELANVANSLGQLRDAREAYGRLAELAAARGDRRSEANARYGSLRVLAEELTETPRPEIRARIMAMAREVLATASAVEYREMEGRAHLILGRLARGEEARKHLAACLDDLTTPADRITCLSAIARREEDAAAALRAIDEALALARQAQDPWSRATVWRERMRVSWAALPRDEAIAHSHLTLDSIETIRAQQSGESGRAGLLSIWAEDYYWFSGSLLDAAAGGGTTGVDEAFGVMERLRARTLLETLEAAQAGAVSDRSDRSNRSNHAARSTFAVLPEVRRALADDEALLSFQIGSNEDAWGDFGGGSWLLVTTREGTRAHRLRRDRVALRSAVRLFSGLFMHRDGSEERAGAGLYGVLLGEALRELPAGVRRLVLVPDDALHQLPFAALRPAAGQAPLAERYEVTLVPSATLWLRWRRSRPAPAPKPLLAVADPVPLGELPRPAATTREGSRLPAGLGPLPHARREGRAAVRRLDGGSLLRLGDKASEGFLKSAPLERFAILHFATHAVLDDRHPERSGVLLTAAPPSEDGLLRIREIVPLHLDGRIVVLSSCRSASGTVLRGEGVLGIARAFFQAGAHTVVASLWPLRDDDGAALFDRFYHHVARGLSVAAALRAAQRDRAEDGAPAYAWAGLVVLGDGGLVPIPGGLPQTTVSPWLWGAGILLLLAAFGLLFWHRKRRVKSVSFP
jgi:CHAT domain-containing protein/tetratricopeptide (TPR) repeat protein